MPIHSIPSSTFATLHFLKAALVESDRLQLSADREEPAGDPLIGIRDTKGLLFRQFVNEVLVGTNGTQNPQGRHRKLTC